MRIDGRSHSIMPFETHFLTSGETVVETHASIRYGASVRYAESGSTSLMRRTTVTTGPHRDPRHAWT